MTRWRPDDLLLAARRAAAKGARFAQAHPARVRAIVTLAIVLAVLLAFLGPFLAGADESRHLSAYSDGPQDVSRVREEIESVTSARDGSTRALATSVYFVESLAAPRDHVLFVFGIERPYTAGETAAIHRFVDAGGTLVLANDVANGNRLAREFGVLFGDRAVLDGGSNYLGDPRSAVVTVPFEGRDWRLLLRSPGYMKLDDPARVSVLAWSSTESYIDVDQDGKIDLNDTAQRFPLVAESRHGQGRVVIIADTGLFMDETLAVPGFDNAGFARALASSTLSGRANALIDESRHAPPPEAAAGDAGLRLLVVATSTPAWRVALAIAAVAAVVLAVVLTRDTEDWSEHKFDVGHERPVPAGLAPTPERLQALAQRALSENYNIPLEYLQTAPFEDLVRLTGEKELVAVATGKERAHESRALYDKLVKGAPTTTVTPRRQES